MAFSNDEIYESFMEDTLVEKYASYDYKQGFTVVYRPFYKLYYSVPIPSKIVRKDYRRLHAYTYRTWRRYFLRQGSELTPQIRKLIVEGVRKQFQQ